MGFDVPHSVVVAILVIVLVLGLEEWAWFKATTKMQRALITGAAVFILLIVINLVWHSPGY